MYGWVKTLCLTKFCRKTEKEKNHVSAKKNEIDDNHLWG